MHQAFLYLSLPSLHDYDVKLPNFTFCREREHKTTTSFFFFWTLIQSFKIDLQKNSPTLNWTKWNKCDKVWSRAYSLFKWRFRSRRRRSFLSSLIPCIGPQICNLRKQPIFRDTTTRFSTKWRLKNRTSTEVPYWLCVTVVTRRLFCKSTRFEAFSNAG